MAYENLVIPKTSVLYLVVPPGRPIRGAYVAVKLADSGCMNLLAAVAIALTVGVVGAMVVPMLLTGVSFRVASVSLLRPANWVFISPFAAGAGWLLGAGGLLTGGVANVRRPAGPRSAGLQQLRSARPMGARAWHSVYRLLIGVYRRRYLPIRDTQRRWRTKMIKAVATAAVGVLLVGACAVPPAPPPSLPFELELSSVGYKIQHWIDRSEPNWCLGYVSVHAPNVEGNTERDPDTGLPLVPSNYFVPVLPSTCHRGGTIQPLWFFDVNPGSDVLFYDCGEGVTVEAAIVDVPRDDYLPWPATFVAEDDYSYADPIDEVVPSTQIILRDSLSSLREHVRTRSAEIRRAEAASCVNWPGVWRR